MNVWKQLSEGFLALLYPNLCLACGHSISPEQDAICISCQYYLPQTNYHLEKENPFTDRFWGRFPLQTGTALYHFSKGGRVQQLIHNLKYQSKPEVGFRLGQILGNALRTRDHYRTIDLIIPVPLHPKKERQRGYNQSDTFARGLAETLEVPWNKKILIRTKSTTTQTKKSRLERLQNVQQVFDLRRSDLLRNQHVLLVDDVLTTGATLEACALKLLKVDGVRISLATIGIAH